MKHFFVILYLILLSTSAYSSNRTIIIGRIHSDFDNLLYSIIVTDKDSALIYNNTFYDKDFQFSLAKKDICRMKISSIQFLSKSFEINLSQDTIFIDTINVSSKILDDVIVSGKRPLIKHELNSTTIDIKDSYLQTIGKANDILERLPGLINNNGNIQLANGGKITFYLNGMKIRIVDELKSIASSDIEKITIDMNPNSKNDGDTEAAVYIFSKKRSINSLFVDASNTVSIGRKVSDSFDLSISKKGKRFGNYLSLNFGYDNIIQHDNTTEGIYNQDYTDYLCYSTKKRSSHYKYKSLDLLYLADYKISSKSDISFQYLGNIMPTKSSEPTKEVINGNEENIIQQKDSHSFLHNFSLNFQNNMDSLSNISVIMDYATMHHRINEDICGYQNLRTKSNDMYNVWGLCADYTKDLNLFSFNIGVSSSFILDKSYYEYKEQSNGYRINDALHALYLTASKSYKTLSFKVGIRGEYEKNRIKELDEKQNVLSDSSYFRIFPSISIINKLSSKCSVGINFSQHITRPTFSQINPRVRYFDAISYEIGNPLLKPTIISNIKSTFKYQNLSINIAYQKKENTIMQVPIAELSINNENLIKFTALNFQHVSKLTTELMYNYSLKKISGYIDSYVCIPFSKIEYKGEAITLDNPLFILSGANEIELGKNFAFSFDYKYMTSGHYELFEKSNSFCLNIGLDKTFFNNQLLMHIGCNDIFNSNNPNDWNLKFKNVKTTMDTDADSRRFDLTIIYRFGTNKVESNKKTANEKTLRRL